MTAFLSAAGGLAGTMLGKLVGLAIVIELIWRGVAWYKKSTDPYWSDEAVAERERFDKRSSRAVEQARDEAAGERVAAELRADYERWKSGRAA